MTSAMTPRKRASSVRSLGVLVVSLALLAAWTPATVEGAKCPQICYPTKLYGTGPQSTNWAKCECTTVVNGLGSGPNSCVCGVCYLSVGGDVTGYGPVPVGSTTCTNGATYCGDCDEASDSGSGGSSNSNSTTAPPSTPQANASTTAPPSSSTSDSSSNESLATWQIALIICSCILVMAVAMMTITSCYCKARNRMKDNMQNEEERHEYEGYWNPNASGGVTERSGHEPLGQVPFNPAMTMGGRSSFTSTHSRPNSNKNMPYSEPTYAVDDRIGAGVGRPPARQSLGSGNDLPGVFQPFPQRDVRPSHEVGSRKNIAIEL